MVPSDDSFDCEAEERPLSEVFQNVNRLIPEDQQLAVVPPETSVSEAAAIMMQNHFSQLPVVENGEVLGVFSFRSFTINALRITDDDRQLGEMPVEEFLESAPYVHVKEELRRLTQYLDTQDVVLVGEPTKLLGVVTPMDAFQFLYKVANPFVLVGEIELAVRALIASCASEADIDACIDNADWPNKRRRAPADLADMNFGHYVYIVGSEANWERFQPVFGGTRHRTRAFLNRARELRNTIFHFSRDITVEEYEELFALRDWLLLRARRADSGRRTVQ